MRGEILFQFLEGNLNSSVHKNEALRALKKGRHLSVILEINLLRATTLPVRHWISFMVHSGGISMIVWIFSRFTYIPLFEIIKPKNLPTRTPKAHFSGFSFMNEILALQTSLIGSARAPPWTHFSQACHPYRPLGHDLFDFWISCSPAFGRWHPRSWGQMAWPDSKRDSL